MSSFFKCNELIMPVICVVFFFSVCAWALQPKSWVMSRDVHGKLCCLLLGQAHFFLISLLDLEANYSTILSWFCHTLTWISHGYTCVPILTPSHSLPTLSLRVIPVHQPWAPCIKTGLAICFTYDNIHISVLFSQIIPPLPSPTESKRLFFTSVSLAVLHIGSSLPSF